MIGELCLQPSRASLKTAISVAVLLLCAGLCIQRAAAGAVLGYSQAEKEGTAEGGGTGVCMCVCLLACLCVCAVLASAYMGVCCVCIYVCMFLI